MTRAAPPCPTALEDLERRHDGPPPATAVRAALLGGCGRAEAMVRAAHLRQHARLAAEARLGAARRRTHIAAGQATGDPWLTRLAATLAHHRHAAVALAVTTPRSGFSPPSPASRPSPPCGAAARP